MKLLKFSLLSALVAVFSAQQVHANLENLCSARNSSLDYVLNQQISQDNEFYKVGEWTSQIKMGGFPRSLGILKRGPFEDANAFTMSWIQNILGDIYLGHQKDPRIITALTRSRHALKRYRMNNGGYNFWPKNSKAGKNGHLPVSDLTTHVMDGLVTIPADADDTSLVYLSLLKNEEILGPEPIEASGLPTDSVREFPFEKLLVKHRDTFRIGVPDFYSKKALYSGAYLTWLKASPIVPLISSALFPQSSGPRVVLGLNLVDCVVNANVLHTLQSFGKDKTKGYKNTCKYLNNMAKHKRYNSCGIYYPDTYWMHMTMARAYEEGAACLQEGVDLNLQHILSMQQQNGSWKNDQIENDEILASALALGALIKTGNKADPVHQDSVRRGLNYLMSVAHQNERNETHWKGGVFFSGGILVRDKVTWKSDAFTTALITSLLFDVQSWFGEELKCSS